jgi:hypothetical protein
MQQLFVSVIAFLGLAFGRDGLVLMLAFMRFRFLVASSNAEHRHQQ